MRKGEPFSKLQKLAPIINNLCSKTKLSRLINLMMIAVTRCFGCNESLLVARVMFRSRRANCSTLFDWKDVCTFLADGDIACTASFLAL